MLRSEFQHVLHTNYAPTEAEALKIKDFCMAPDIEVQKLELEASRLQAALNAVRLKQNEYKDAITAHRALLSPIRRLSPELLQTVFAFCIAEFPVMHVSEAPLLLGRICKSWRDIVYHTAELWSGVHVVAPSGYNPKHWFLRHEALREWIARSGDCPLRISFHADHTAGEIDNFLDLIVPQSPRWEQITFNIPATCFKQLEDAFSGIIALPRLRSFTLSHKLVRNIRYGLRSRSLNSCPTNPLRLLELCTSLHCISVHIFSDPHHRVTLPICIAVTLQELDVDYHAMFGSDLTQLFNFIAPCQNLRIFRIRSSFKFVPATQPPSFVALPALEHLSTDMHSIQRLDTVSLCPSLTLLNHLVTPRLLHLDLMNVLYVKDASLSLMNLFARSSCSLRTLSLRLMDDKQNLTPLLSSLEYTTNLRELRIDCWDTGRDATESLNTPYRDAFLLGLAYTASTNYCPNLTHLTLGNYSRGINVDSLLILVRSRLKPPPECARIQTLDLRGLLPPPRALRTFEAAVPVDPDFKASLLLVKELSAQGLTILLPDCVTADPPLLSPWTGLIPQGGDGHKVGIYGY